MGVTPCQFGSDLRNQVFRDGIDPDFIEVVWVFCYCAHRLPVGRFSLSYSLEIVPGHGLSDATRFLLTIDFYSHFCDYLKAFFVDLIDTRKLAPGPNF